MGGLDIAAGLIVAATFVITIHSFIDAGRALRAKRRAHYAVKSRLADDDVLRALAGRSRLENSEIDEIIRRIEAATVSLSPDDRRVVDKGLHQPSRRGIRRFVQNLVAAS